MKAMVLAAGKGTRLAPLTAEIPKPLAPVAGKPIIQHIFELLESSGVEEVYSNVHYLADAILEHYGQQTRINGMKVSFTREEELTGTAGGVKRISGRFDDTFVVIMGDALTDVDLREVVAFHKERGALATLALMSVSDTSQYGVVGLDPESNIVAFQEKPDPEEAISTLANTGIYVLEPEVLSYIPDGTFFDFANDVFPRLLEAGEKFVGYEGGFYWSDIGTLEAYMAAQGDVLSGRVCVEVPGEPWCSNLWAGRGARVHPTADLAGRAVLGEGSVIGPATTLAGDVAVGDWSRVGAGAYVRNSVLLPGSLVGAGSRLEDCIIGPGREVLPGQWISGEVLVGQSRRSRSAPRVLSEAAP